MAIIDVVKFDGLRSRDWLVYKFPSTLVFGTRLIVNEGQVAVFVKGGQVCDLFYPGSYILDTDNLPVLFHIFNLPYGGNTPFTAEVYFINTKTKLDIPWGTSDPIQLIDPKYFVKLRIRAFGQMGLKLMDYSLFFRELIGSMNQNDIVSFDKIKLFYRGMVVTKVKSIISEMILAEKSSALEISAHLDDISDKCREEISGEFQKYGFNVVNFFVQSINFPDDDFAKINKILEDKAAFEIMGDGRYVTKRSFDVYEGAANNNNGVAGFCRRRNRRRGRDERGPGGRGDGSPDKSRTDGDLPEMRGKIRTGKQVLQYLRSKAGGGEKTLSQLRKRK